MKKIKLFLAAIAAMVGMSAFAQTDVTGTYLTNADFATGTPIDNNVCTYGKDMEANGTTYYGAQDIEGWTNASVGASADGYDGCGVAGALFAYGETPWLAGPGTVAPATDPKDNTSNAVGLCAVWENSVQYTQNVTLSAGSYTVVFKVYNATSGSGNSSGVIATDLFGFVKDGGTAYYAPNNTFAIGQWSTVAVTFTLAEETAGKISMGYVSANAGNAAMPHLFVDNVKILKNEKAIDCTSKVNKSGWTGATDGYQGGTINTAREYGNKTVGRHIYQTVSGLDNGTYEVAVYSTSQKEWNGSLANDAGDVAYVFAEGAYELKEWMNARARAGYPGDENMGIYTISGVKVTDGTLTIGMGLAKADLTEWHHMQIKSLIHTNDPDLSDFVEAYENALAAAKAVDQSKKMATSIKTALSDAIDKYDEGNVNEKNADALETATEALRAATNKANTSIASYAIIESGVVRTDILDGWTCTNSNTFHINTWSVEGNPGNDPSGMTTPFIENWRNKNDNAGLGEGTFSYTLEGLEPGEVYYAQALIRSYNERNSDAPNGPTFFINDSETNLATEGTTFTYNGMSGIYATLGTAATVGDDGKITLGAKIANDANYNWVAFKNVSIQSMDAAFNAAVAKVTVLEGTIPTATYDAAFAVVTAYSDANYPKTAGEFETAIAAIEAAATTASVCVQPYSDWKAIKATTEGGSKYVVLADFAQALDNDVESATQASDITTAVTELRNAEANYDSYIALKPQAEALVAVDSDNSEAQNTLNNAISSAVTAVEGATTAVDIANAANDLKSAMVTYAGAANPTGNARFDLTFMLTNPDLTSCTGWAPADGWYTDQNFGTQNSQVMNDNQDVANSADPTKYAMYEYWSGSSNATSGFTVYQKVTLPVGTYKMEALCVAGWGYQASNPSGARNVTFSANDVDGTQITTATLEEASLEFVQTEAGEVKIGLKAHEGNTSNWMGIGYVTFYKVAEKSVIIDENEDYTPESLAGTATLKRTFAANAETWNTFVVPFQITNEELELAFGNSVSVAEFSDAGKSEDDVTINFTIMGTPAIQANQPVLIKGVTPSINNEYTFKNRTVAAGAVLKEGNYFNFVGTYKASIEIPENDYFIGSNKLWKSQGSTNIKGTRAYLTAKDGVGANVKLFIDGIETGISEINGTAVESGAIYNLAGQRVSNAQKGIYIVNGKKVIIK